MTPLLVLLFVSCSSTGNVPAAPSNLSAKPEVAKIVLTWKDNSDDETGFAIFRAEGDASTYAALANVGANVTTYEDTDVAVDGSYRYRVTALGTSGVSAPAAAGDDSPISPQNGTPVADAKTVTTDEAVAVAFSLTGSDPEGAALTFALASDAANGTATVASDGAATYTPDAGYIGSDSFTFTVSDGASTSVAAVVTIGVVEVNFAPVIDQGASATITIDEETTSAPLALSATDVDGDNLTWRISAQAGAGTAAVDADGNVTYTGVKDFFGADSFTVQVSDGNDVDTIAVSVQVANVQDAPTIDQASASIATDEDTQGMTALSATDVDGDSLSWSLGTAATNGTAGVDASTGNVTYVPNANFNGTDSFVVQVSDGTDVDTLTVSVSVTAVNDAPVVDQGASATITTDEETTSAPLALSATDVEGDDLSWSIRAQGSNGTAVVDGSGNVTYTGNQNFFGADSFAVQVSDGNDVDTIVVSVTVNNINDAPTIDQASASIATDEDTQGTTALTATDVDEDTLSWSIGTGASNGTASVDASTGNVTYVPNANFNSSDSFTVIVTDGSRTGDTITVDVTVAAVNDAPVVDQGASASITTEEEVTSAPLALSATDVENDGITWRVSAQAGNGTAVVNSSGSVTYTGDRDFFGSDSFTVEASDGTDVDTIVVSVTVNNTQDLPVAVDDSFATDEDTLLAGNVLTEPNAQGAYDYDPDQEPIYVVDSDLTVAGVNPVRNPSSGTLTLATDGSFSYQPNAHYEGQDSFVYAIRDANSGMNVEATVTITVVAVNDAPVITNASASITTDEEVTSSPALALGATDVENDPLTWRISAQAGNGTAAVDAGGNVTYTGNQDFFGSDSFTVEASDGTDIDTIVVSVTVNNVNDAPTIDQADPAALNTNEDTPGTLALSATDVDGDSLSWSLGSLATNGTAGVDTSTGSITYDPAADFNGTDSFTVIVTDSNATTDEITINVSVAAVNDAPVVDQGASASITTDEEVTSAPLALSATDVDGDTITWRISAPGAGDGTAAVDANGNVTYTGNQDFFGSDSFTVEASDGTDIDTIVVSVTVNNINDAPTIDQASASIATDEDTQGTTALAATDVDGDSLSWSLDSFAVAGHGVASVDASGNVAYVPNADFNGTDSFTVVVTDASGATDTITVDVTVAAVNDAPTIGQGEFASINTNEETTSAPLALSATDVDGDTITWRISAQAGSGTAVVDAGGNVTYAGAADFFGDDWFTVEASDGTDVDTIVVEVTVNNVQDAPTIDQASASIATDEDTQGTTALTATDVDEDTLSWSIGTGASNGTASVDASTGNVTYVPNANFNGTDSFVVQVSDGTDVDTLTVSVSVTAVNDAPIVGNDTGAVRYDTVLTEVDDGAGGTVNTLLANDSDVEGDAISVVLFDTTSTLGATVQDVVSNGQFIYDPRGVDALAGCGPHTDTFGYTVRDAKGAETRGTVTVTVEGNCSPIITEGDSTLLTTAEDTQGTLTLNATDVNASDTLTWSLGTVATNGTAGVDTSTGSITYDPAADFNGTDSFTVIVTDSIGATDEITINVTVTAMNDAPTDITLSSANVDENGTSEEYVGTFSVVDIDSSDHSYTITSSDFHLHGNELITNGGYDYEVQSSYTITVRATDVDGTYIEKDFTITVNDLLEASHVVTWTTAGDGVYSFSGSGTTVGAPNEYDGYWDNSGDHVYKLQVPVGANPTFTFSLCGSPYFDTYAYLLDGNGNLLAADDDGLWETCDLGSKIVMDLTAGSTYYFVVDGYGREEGDYTLSIGN